MSNKFSIGDKVLRVSTQQAHTILDMRWQEDADVMELDGEWKKATGWFYTIDNVPFAWILERALRPMPDDTIDPAFTKCIAGLDILETTE